MSGRALDASLLVTASVTWTYSVRDPPRHTQQCNHQSIFAFDSWDHGAIRPDDPRAGTASWAWEAQRPALRARRSRAPQPRAAHAGFRDRCWDRGLRSARSRGRSVSTL